MGLKDKIRDNFKMVAFKTYLETVYNKDFEELREASINPRKSAEQGLRNILTYAKDTSYGVEHHFSYILEAKDDTELYKRYESEVPVNTYNDFEKYIDISKHGAENVLIPGKPVFYLTTSGTTGKPKFLPLSAEYIKYMITLQYMQLATFSHKTDDIFKGKILAVTSKCVEDVAPDNTPVGSTSGATRAKTNSFSQERLAVPDCVFEIKDYAARYYILMRFAIEQDVRLILAPNPSTILELMYNSDKYYDEYCNDIEKGIVSDKVNIEPEVRAELEAAVKPNPKRAAELRAIKANTPNPTPADYWQNMRILCTWKCGNTAFYNKKLDSLFPADTIHVELGYYASECRFGITLHRDNDGTVTFPHKIYLEFIAEEDLEKENPHYYKIFELEVGKRYCPLVTTNSGLYRYNMNDLIEAGKPYHNTPTIFMVQKINGIVSMTGEKLYEKQFTTAVQNASSETGHAVEFYMGFADIEESRYQFYYEFIDRSVTQEQADEFNNIVEKYLQEYNIEYESKRKSLRLKEPVAHILPEHSFEDFKLKLLDQGRRDGQFKLCHLVQNDNMHSIIKEIALS